MTVVHIMPCVVAHAMMSCAHHVAHACWQASCPSAFIAHCNSIISLSFLQTEQLLLELTTSHFNPSNNKNTNWNMLKRILIAI